VVFIFTFFLDTLSPFPIDRYLWEGREAALHSLIILDYQPLINLTAQRPGTHFFMLSLLFEQGLILAQPMTILLVEQP